MVSYENMTISKMYSSSILQSARALFCGLFPPPPYLAIWMLWINSTLLNKFHSCLSTFCLWFLQLPFHCITLPFYFFFLSWFPFISAMCSILLLLWSIIPACCWYRSIVRYIFPIIWFPPAPPLDILNFVTLFLSLNDLCDIILQLLHPESVFWQQKLPHF